MRGSPSIGVLMGGPSAEHAISVKSGQGVVASLTRRGWHVDAILIPHTLSLEGASEFARRALQAADVELVFIALHGPFGEDGTIQAICEEFRLPYTGSDAQASRLGLNKVASRVRFERAGLGVPRWRVLDPADRQALDGCVGQFGFPVVVKPTNQGSSIGVSIVAHHGELAQAVQDATRYDTRILVEEFIGGRELTVGILGHEALPLVEIRPTAHRFFDYTAKYTPGETEYLVPAALEGPLTSRVQAAGLRAHDALGCRHFSRVDLILNEASEPVILEVNTIPGLTATSLLPKAAACLGIPYDELCERLVRMALSQNQREESIVLSR